jgi:alkylresorcinol/alkylpyrone synthase
MPYIIGLGTAVPSNVVHQAEARDYAAQHFTRFLPHMDRLATVFKHAAIDTRYFVVPRDWWENKEHTFQECNDVYIREATALCQQAIDRALASAGVNAQDVNNLFFVNSTGIATPSIDAMLINRLGMCDDVRRTPIWGLGCAGGVVGLARATDMARAYPESITVVVAVETCSLTFKFDDPSKTNFIATSLFADGAAAAVIAGDQRASSGVEILDSQSTLWPNSLRVMGLDVVNSGFALVLGVEIPAYVADSFRPVVDRFLMKHGLHIQQIEHFIFHPGGAKVIESYDEALDLTNGHLNPSREVLRQYGNMSSPTVLFVLDYIMQNSEIHPGDYGLAAAMGPGFSAEQLLVRF